MKSVLSTHDGPIYVNVYLDVLQPSGQKKYHLTHAEKHKLYQDLAKDILGKF